MQGFTADGHALCAVAGTGADLTCSRFTSAATSAWLTNNTLTPSSASCSQLSVPNALVLDVVTSAGDFIRLQAQYAGNGYDTLVDESGANLSEGQRQRIALARAIVRDAPIIILDETSAHVDLLTERKIYENIMALPGKTVIIVSHRPSVLQAADTIYSIAGGRLTRVGSFGEFEEKLGHGELLRAMEFIH